MLHVNIQNLVSGILFIIFGSFVSIMSSLLPMGTGRNMGPGYFPYYVGLLLVLAGIITTVLAATSNETSSISPPPYRAIVSVIGSLVAFGLTVESFGFIAAISLVIGVSAFAYKGSSLKETIISIIILIPAVYLIFGVILGQPIRLMPALGW